jgi:ATP-dependent RNA helicase RhlE
MSFNSFGLSAAILATLEKQNFVTPKPIQELAIPEIMKANDLLGIAQTGSGKTASYVLPILMKVLTSGATKNRHIKALILVPTRELAMQVNEVIQVFSANLERRVKSMAVYGGASINPQMIGMQHVEILVATPGRLLELVKSKALSLAEVTTFVMDEADKLLNLGFKQELTEILSMLPAKKQSLLFSATLSEDVKGVHELFLKNPIVIHIKPEDTNPNLIEHQAYKVTEERKGPYLRYLIKDKNIGQLLIFTSSGLKAESLAHKLTKNGIPARSIHGKLSQGARTKALSQFKSKDITVLVATDLLARGIDIDLLPCVINYELPRSPKDYVHRIGRTGRAGASGLAISLLTEEDLHHFKVIQKKMGVRVAITETDKVNLHGY